MTREPNETLYDYLLRLRRAEPHPERVGKLARTSVRSPDDLVAALRTAQTHPQEGLTSIILGLAFRNQDPSLAAVLRDIVDGRDPRLGLEDAVELLGELRDVEAVPSLTRLLVSPPEWDFGGSVGAKAVDSLAAIGTDEARAAVRLAITSPLPRVWEATIGPIVDGGFDPDGESLLVLGRRLIAEDPEYHRIDDVLMALAKMNTSQAWAIVESAAKSDNAECLAVATDLLRERPQDIPPKPR